MIQVVCTFYYMLLHVVACCWELFVLFETGQNFEPKTPNISFGPWSPMRSATVLDQFAQPFQHCCVKPHANGRNIVGCYILRPFAHPVGCCWMLLGLLRKVWNRSNFSANNSQHFFVPGSPKRSATMLDPFAQLFQHCWGHARSLPMVYKDLWVVSFPRCTAGPNIAGSCCMRLQTTAKTQATTPNIVGATMLGVVTSVCTQSKSSASSFESRRRRHMWDVGYRSWSCAEWFFSWYSGTTFVVKIHSNFSSIRQCRQRAILLMCYQDIVLLALYLWGSPRFSIHRRGSTLVSSVFQKSVRKIIKK